MYGARRLTALAALALAALAPTASCAGPGGSSPDAGCPAEGCVDEVVVTGVLHVIRNGETTYHLVDGDGRSTELRVSEDAAAEHGGLLALDRRPVRVSGVRVTPDLLRVTSIRPDER